MTVYLTSANSRKMLGTIVFVLFVLFMLKYVFTGDMAKKSNAASKGDTFFNVGSTTTSGATSSTAGQTTTTGGATSSNAGQTTTTGGVTSSTAGQTTTTGGSTSSTAGQTTTTGGVTSSTAGQTTTTGGSTSSTAGQTTTTGGATSSTSGQTSATGGATSSTAGQTTTTGYNICSQISSTGYNLGEKMVMVNSAINSDGTPCQQATSEEQIQDLFYIGALKMIGQTRSYLISKKAYDDTITVIERMDANDLENFVVNLAEVYAKDNGILDKAVTYFNGRNRQSDASKLTQLKTVIRGDNPPTATLLDETNPLIIEHLDLSAGNFNSIERQLRIGNCYVSASDIQGLNKCELHAYLRNLTHMMKRHMERACTHCDMSDPNDFVPRTRAEQTEVLRTGECNQLTNSIRLHSMPDECLSGRGGGTDSTQPPSTTASQITVAQTTPSQTSAPSVTSQTPPETTTQSSQQPGHGVPTNAPGMNVNDVGNSLAGTGEVSSTMGYYNYGSGIINTPDPMTYDNGADYRGVANATRMNGGNFNVNANDDENNMQKIVQKDMKGVSNIFAPKIIIKNYNGKPEDNEIKAYNA